MLLFRLPTVIAGLMGQSDGLHVVLTPDNFGEPAGQRDEGGKEEKRTSERNSVLYLAMLASRRFTVHYFR